MRAFLYSLVASGTSVILWVQTFHTPFLDRLFIGATTAGEAYFYVPLLPIIFWCFNKPFARRLTYLLLLSNYVNSFFKESYQIPRTSDPLVRILRHERTPSFPSGHAQNSTVFWGYLALLIRRLWFWVFAVLLILTISFSRIYLGVHYPVDVIGGWVIGILFLAAFVGPGERVIVPWLYPLPFAACLTVAIVGPVVLLFVHPGDYLNLYPAEDAVVVAGALLGLSIGFLLEGRYVRFDPGGAWPRRLLRFLVGAALVGGAYLSLGALLPARGPAALLVAEHILQYGLTGFMLACGAPWVFVRARLADVEPPPGEAMEMAPSGVTGP